MNISIPAEPVYRTCCAYNSSIGKMEFRTYNYTKMLQKMKDSTPPKGVTYWEPDEYGRVFIDPNHPMQATLEPDTPRDYSKVRLPDPGSYGLPASGKTERQMKKEEEQKIQEERLRRFREERERIAQQEATVRRLCMAALSARR